MHAATSNYQPLLVNGFIVLQWCMANNASESFIAGLVNAEHNLARVVFNILQRGRTLGQSNYFDRIIGDQYISQTNQLQACY